MSLSVHDTTLTKTTSSDCNQRGNFYLGARERASPFKKGLSPAAILSDTSAAFTPVQH